MASDNDGINAGQVIIRPGGLMTPLDSVFNAVGVATSPGAVFDAGETAICLRGQKISNNAVLDAVGASISPGCPFPSHEASLTMSNNFVFNTEGVSELESHGNSLFDLVVSNSYSTFILTEYVPIQV